MNPILQPLISSPLLPQYVAELNCILQEEELRKRKFVQDLDEDVKAEFLLGEVIIHSPARDLHITTLQNIQFLIFSFLRSNPIGVIRTEQAMIRFKRSNLMPDLSYWPKEVAAGFEADTKIYPPPSFIIEILSPSTEQYDRKAKKDEYELNGVKEYWIVDADNKTIEQYLLEDQQYNFKEKLSHGTIQAILLAGMELQLNDIFS